VTKQKWKLTLVSSIAALSIGTAALVQQAVSASEEEHNKQQLPITDVKPPPMSKTGPVTFAKPDGTAVETSWETLRAHVAEYTRTHPAPEGGTYSWGMNAAGEFVPMEICYPRPRGCQTIVK
jgi:hypothetical protein